VTFCITASVLPPLDFGQLLTSLLETNTMRVFSRAISSTLGSKPVQFFLNVLLPNRFANYKINEVIWALVSYLSAVNPGPGVQIWPGEGGGARAAPGGAGKGGAAPGLWLSPQRAATPRTAQALTLRPLPHPNPPPHPTRPPGKYHKNPYPMWEWITMMVIPPTPDEIDGIVEMGVKDATAWAQEHGLLPAAGHRHRSLLR
jgi:hypothetical protein